MTYMEIAEKLRQEIFLGRIASGAKLSARRIAERYGVSYLTGNRALNLLNEQNLIIRKPRGGSYVNEAGSRSRLIGFSIEHYRQNVFNQTAGVFREILLSEFRKRNFKVRMLSPNDWSPEWLGDLDALLFSHELDRKQEKSAASLGIPVLQFYGERIWNHPFHQAVIDLESGFRELFRHVTQERFRKAFIVTADDATMSLRERHMKISHAAPVASRGFLPGVWKLFWPTTFCRNATGPSGRSLDHAAPETSCFPAETISLQDSSAR